MHLTGISCVILSFCILYSQQYPVARNPANGKKLQSFKEKRHHEFNSSCTDAPESENADLEKIGNCCTKEHHENESLEHSKHTHDHNDQHTLKHSSSCCCCNAHLPNHEKHTDEKKRHVHTRTCQNHRDKLSCKEFKAIRRFLQAQKPVPETRIMKIVRKAECADQGENVDDPPANKNCEEATQTDEPGTDSNSVDSSNDECNESGGSDTASESSNEPEGKKAEAESNCNNEEPASSAEEEPDTSECGAEEESNSEGEAEPNEVVDPKTGGAANECDGNEEGNNESGSEEEAEPASESPPETECGSQSAEGDESVCGSDTGDESNASEEEPEETPSEKPVCEPSSNAETEPETAEQNEDDQGEESEAPAEAASEEESNPPQNESDNNCDGPAVTKEDPGSSVEAQTDLVTEQKEECASKADVTANELGNDSTTAEYHTDEESSDQCGDKADKTGEEAETESNTEVNTTEEGNECVTVTDANTDVGADSTTENSPSEGGSDDQCSNDAGADEDAQANEPEDTSEESGEENVESSSDAGSENNNSCAEDQSEPKCRKRSNAVIEISHEKFRRRSTIPVKKSRLTKAIRKRKLDADDADTALNAEKAYETRPTRRAKRHANAHALKHLRRRTVKKSLEENNSRRVHQVKREQAEDETECGNGQNSKCKKA